MEATKGISDVSTHWAGTTSAGDGISENAGRRAMRRDPVTTIIIVSSED
jgi:hypothetical protein